jgi:hypothetical protein
MAPSQLIDRYLAALQDHLDQAPDAGDILAEVEDHLRETATSYRHGGLDAEGAEARALEAFGSPRLVARAFADASGTKGLAMPTTFTRRAGLAAIASPLVLLAAMPALFADEWITGRTTGWYFAGNNAILIALALLMVAMVGMRARHGGTLGTLGLAGLILTGLGIAVVLAQFSWGLLLWLVPISIGVALFAVAIARARVLSRVAATLFGTGLLLTAALALRYGLFTPEGEDPIWPYGPMWPSSLIGIAVFGLGLTWLGWQLRSEHPVDTNQGMAPAT